ncbi:MAG: helix-turn-helix domain-containing protein [Candidatus Coproplasma sp.]
MTFALRLKELRENKHISQKQLAIDLDVGIGSVGMWESSDRTPPAKKLKLIAEYFGVSIDYLLGGECTNGTAVKAPMGASSTEYTAEERQLIEDFRKLNYYKQKLIKDNIKAMLPAEAESKKKKDI